VSWTALRIGHAERREEVIASLFASGAQGVQEDGDAIVTHFPPGTDMEVVLRAVREADPAADAVTSPTPEVDWSLAWRDRLRAYSLGTLTVAPPWLAEGCDPGRTVAIDPGMAFGTGDHASTRGVVRLMQHYLQPGFVVADLGSGSGILSIAAAKLGASRVFAVESDPDARDNAAENIARNGVGDVVHWFEGDAAVFLPLVAPVDLIVANIISSVLVELLPAMARALPSGGVAVLAGILADEAPWMREVFDADGWRVLEDDHEDGWWGVAIARP
jgi:ribosomal protein L11 methyltransferase